MEDAQSAAPANKNRRSLKSVDRTKWGEHMTKCMTFRFTPSQHRLMVDVGGNTVISGLLQAAVVSPAETTADGRLIDALRLLMGAEPPRILIRDRSNPGGREALVKWMSTTPKITPKWLNPAQALAAAERMAGD